MWQNLETWKWVTKLHLCAMHVKSDFPFLLPYSYFYKMTFKKILFAIRKLVSKYKCIFIFHPCCTWFTYIIPLHVAVLFPYEK
jgi:hypothetical protein